jgi:hypothetical protein
MSRFNITLPEHQPTERELILGRISKFEELSLGNIKRLSNVKRLAHIYSAVLISRRQNSQYSDSLCIHNDVKNILLTRLLIR